MPITYHFAFCRFRFLHFAIFWISLVCFTPICYGYNFAIFGGTGRIGTAIAQHLLKQSPSSNIVLLGRSSEKGEEAVREVLSLSSPKESSQVQWKLVNDCWNADALKTPLMDADCVLHAAGPFLDRQPIPLQVAINSEKCKVYVDVSDPLEYLEDSQKLGENAQETSTSCLLAAGAFPGMSNVLAMEAASKLKKSPSPDKSSTVMVQDVRFNYFTAGLGGSGDVNLYITNLGFGEAMAQYDNGNLRMFQALSGLLLGQVDFSLDNLNQQDLQENSSNDSNSANGKFNLEDVKNRVGRQTVFAWPFPEAATVAKELNIQGSSSAAMGTAPDLWNTMLGILVSLVPRKLWKSEKFSQFMADFSQPLVKATDTLVLGGKETHAVRVDVTGAVVDEDGRREGVSIVQAHDSFRTCVGQSCAEFALDMLENPQTGVWLPEQRYREVDDRKRIIEKLTSTPGTFCYTGPCCVSPADKETQVLGPSNMESALKLANELESKM